MEGAQEVTLVLYWKNVKEKRLDLFQKKPRPFLNYPSRNFKKVLVCEKSV
jgi:hypothetical protein